VSTNIQSLHCQILLKVIFELYDQVARDDVGTIRIQRPSKGPFYVSPKTIDDLIANLGKWARLLYFIFAYCMVFPTRFFKWLNFFIRLYKFASVGLTALGVYMIANHAIRYILERRRRSELQKRYSSLEICPMHTIPLHLTLPCTFNNLNNFMQGSRCSC
jgi:hypothetical protein